MRKSWSNRWWCWIVGHKKELAFDSMEPSPGYDVVRGGWFHLSHFRVECKRCGVRL